MVRAAWGESSIAQDATGRWHGWVSMGSGRGGALDRRHVPGTTRGPVVKTVRVLEAQRNAGAIPQSGRPSTVDAWLEHWLTTIAAARVRPSTLQDYESKVRQRVNPALGHHRLDRLQPEHLERFYAELLTEDWLPRPSCRSIGCCRGR